MREEILRRSEGACEACREQPPVHVHHLTYARLGEELEADLLAVCDQCHESIHGRSWPPRIDTEGCARWHVCYGCSELIPPYVVDPGKGEGACPFCGTRQEEWLASH